jgi:chitodextrinase
MHFHRRLPALRRGTLGFLLLTASSSLSNAVGPAVPAASHPAYPLKVSANRRYLVDQNEAPFLIAGDAPQWMILAISTADAELFLANREAYGFNAMWVNLVGGFVNGATYDGIPPFTVEGDLATPNEPYFGRADEMIRLAAQHGQVVILDPIETTAWLPVLRSNGVAKARAYGRYLGRRYKDFDNIVWMSGNDFQTWSDPDDDAVVQAVALGIKDEDARHLHTVELHVPVSGSLDDPSWAPIIDLNASYSYTPTYAQVLKDYNRPNFIPTFLVEANYEFEDNTQAEPGSPLVLRLQEYRAQLSGATGQVYGSGYTWPFQDGWKTFLDSPGSAQFERMTRVFASRRWYDLVPDQAHTLVTAGYGTYEEFGTNLASDYATAAVTADGMLAMAYVPRLRTFTVNMAKLSGPVSARWYDPAEGTFTAAAGAPLDNHGARAFTPPGPNADGDGDWLLVLEVSGPPDETAPSVPGDLQAVAASASAVDLAWSAATDDVGVAGYRVFRDDVLVGSTAATSCTDAGLSPSTAYVYTVAAFDGAGNLSDRSAPVGVTTSAASSSTLLAAYGFSEGAGSTTADSSGNGITGTLVGATWTTGRHAGGLLFDGGGAYVDLGNPAALRLRSSFTVSAWVNESANVSDDAIIVSRSTGSAGWELKSSPDTGMRTFALAVFDPGGSYVARYSAIVRAVGTWYHVAGVYDAAARKLDLYVNGTLSNGILVGAVPAAISDAAETASIGRRAGGFHIRGVIDDVRVQGRALTAGEIQSDMSSPQ